MNGIDWIKEERQEQIEKHGFDAEHDDKGFNANSEMLQAAGYLMGEVARGKNLSDTFWVDFPQPWNLDFKKKFDQKSDIEKLAVAGALVAAEIDRMLREVDRIRDERSS